MLTVGLLVMLVMIGSTFMLVSHLNAKNAEAVITRNQSMQVAGGAVNRLAKMLKADLHIGNQGPFSEGGLAGDPTSWMAYSDMPRDTTHSAWWSLKAHPDLYLAHNDNTRELFSQLYPIDSGEGIQKIDVTARGEDNGWLRNARSVSSTGDRYWIAVRVVDLSGLACVNTGGTVTGNQSDIIVPAAPTLYDLEGIVGTFAYSRIRNARTGSSSPNLLQYFTRGASRLLNPQDLAYQPFAISDEMYLRYYQNDAVTEAGRFIDEVGELNDTARSLITTFNCSRQLLRWPRQEGETLLVLDSSAKRDDIYDRLLRMMEDARYGKDASQRKRMAACFTANLWAYTDPEGDDAPWKYEKGGFTAWGLKQQLVISEAYAAHTPESAPNANDHVGGFAIELYNPTGEDINLGDYRLKIGSDEVDLSNETVSANGGRIVLYSFEEGINHDENKREDHTGLDTSGGDWVEVDSPKIRFDEDKTVQLFRGEVIIDQVSADDVGYSGVNIRTSPAGSEDIRRDDSLDRARYNMALYESFSGGQKHRLTKQNSLDGDTFKDKALHSVPIIDVASLGHSSMRSLGELANVYLTGPQKKGSDHIPFSHAILNEDTEAVDFSDTPGRGRLSFYPESVGVESEYYPRLPLGCLFGEFFAMNAGDPTRPDDLRRAYGLININTAPEAVLENLPWPSSVKFDGKTVTINRSAVVDEILKYRDGQTAPYQAFVQDLRNGQQLPSFLSPGEIAVPLAHYMCKRLGWDPAVDPGNNSGAREIVQHPDFVRARDELYTAVANLITVRSDTYAAVIHVQVGEDVPTKNVWKYLAILDRSNCNDADDEPAILLFTPLK
jgi:hypothetical protein